jgi:hypothetical protein
VYVWGWFDFEAKLILMKKVISFLFFSIVYFGATAQAPDSLSFQAVIRAEDGTLLADQSVSARVGIYQGAEDGTKVFEETHTATTNSNGLLTLLIGGGTNVTGDLSTIDWGAGPYFIKREIDPNGGTDYVISGTSQFLSVPYALYAASGGSADNMGNHTASQDLDMNGNVITDLAGSTGDANPLKIEVRRDSQDIYIQSYDEIYITTFDSIGVNDPDGNPYSTSGDIELISGDDLIIKTLGDDIEITAQDHLDLVALDDIEIIAEGDNITINNKNTSVGEDDDLDFISDDDINLTADDEIVLEGDNITIESTSTSQNTIIKSGNDIELIFNDDDDDFVEIWRGSTFLYTLPNVRGEVGQILLRDRDGMSEYHSDWSPYKFPLTDGSSGQVLQTDGSGNVTWATSGGASKLDDLSDATKTSNFSLILGATNHPIQNISTGSLYNTAVGHAVLNSINSSTASYNVAIGGRTLFSLTTGKNNVAVGYNSASNLTTGERNIGIGYHALKGTSNSAYYNNVVIGSYAFENVTTGGNNTVVGDAALSKGTTSSSNTIVGGAAANETTTGVGNVAMGNYALWKNQEGNFNTAIGYHSMRAGAVPSSNLYSTQYVTALGASSGDFNQGDNNTYLGAKTGGTNFDTGTTGDNNTYIGFEAAPSSGTVSNEITLGNSAITSLRCQVTSITALSDRRDKKNIRTISEGIDFVKKLNPVIFDWNQRDGNKVDVPAAGFIAQDLLELQNKSEIGEYLDLVSTNNPDKLEARYNNLLPVLVKAIQEQQAIIETLKVELKSSREVNAQLMDKYENLEASVFALTKSFQNLNIQKDKTLESED